MRELNTLAEATLSDIDGLEGSERWSGRKELTQAMELIAAALITRRRRDSVREVSSGEAPGGCPAQAAAFSSFLSPTLQWRR